MVEHKPIQFVGHAIVKSYGLNLYNHTSPSIPPPSPPQAMSIGNDNYSTQVFINAPHGAFGPGDNLALSFYAKPDDPSVTIKKASVVLERRIEARERSPSPQPSSSSGLTTTEKSSYFKRSISPKPFFDRLSSTSSEPEKEKEKAIVNKITDASTDEVIPGSGGTVWCHMNLALQKRGAHWDIGETCKTELATITFYLKVKIWIKAGRTTREFNCPTLPLLITGASMAERVAAQNAAMALLPVTPHKRKHRSSRRGLYMHEGTLDINHDLLGSAPTEIPIRSKPSKSSKSDPRDRTVSSPILPIRGVVTDIRPILRSSDLHNTTTTTTGIRSTSNALSNNVEHTQVPTGPTISFMFPSVLGGHPETPTLPPIRTILEPPSTSSSASPSYAESYALLRQFQQSQPSYGRRVSATTSEEDEQPLRSRPKLQYGETEASMIDNFDKPNNQHHTGLGLPSLDALGLGLPFVPEDQRPRSRPKTAPMVSTFSRYVPPPLSGHLTVDVQDRATPGDGQIRPVSMATSQPSIERNTSGNFAFGLPTVPGPPQPQSRM